MEPWMVVLYPPKANLRQGEELYCRDRDEGKARVLAGMG